ncbi:hypothetical protein [Neobacillus sp. 19]|uniref:hypothetical protein n=1 Tax=Neobacillus sp. 19 TaxID=3394458 RepID=UPI003BF72EF9
MQRLTDEQLAEIRKRAEAATPGPWVWEKFALDEDDWDTEMPWLGNATESVMDFGDCEQYYPTQGTPPNDADAEFIAHARQDVPKLLAEVARLNRKNNLYRKALRSAVMGAVDITSEEEFDKLLAQVEAEIKYEKKCEALRNAED